MFLKVYCCLYIKFTFLYLPPKIIIIISVLTIKIPFTNNNKANLNLLSKTKLLNTHVYDYNIYSHIFDCFCVVVFVLPSTGVPWETNKVMFCS